MPAWVFCKYGQSCVHLMATSIEVNQPCVACNASHHIFNRWHVTVDCTVNNGRGFVKNFDNFRRAVGMCRCQLAIMPRWPCQIQSLLECSFIFVCAENMASYVDTRTMLTLEQNVFNIKITIEKYNATEVVLAARQRCTILCVLKT